MREERILQTSAESEISADTNSSNDKTAGVKIYLCHTCYNVFTDKHYSKTRKYCSYKCRNESFKIPAAVRLADYSEPCDFSDCILWTRRKDKDGYGQMHVDGKVEKTHRVAYEIANNTKIKTGNVVMHSCDTPACINPEHLIEGTQADNIRDMMNKGRHSSTHKLTPDDVKKIRLDSRATAAIASDYGVSASSILGVKQRRFWKHVL